MLLLHLAVIFFLYFNLLRAEGKLKLIMKTTIASVSLNVVLNPLFLFTFDMGMAGVSIATVISQVIVLVVILVYYLRDKAIIKLRVRYFAPDLKIIYTSCLLGTSSMFRMCGSAILNVLINKIAGNYGGVDGIASFGLAYRLIIFMFMPIMGFIQGGQPLFGFNYGAGKVYRMRKILNCSFVITISISCMMIVLVLLFSERIIPIFSNNINIILDTPKYLKWLTLALPFIAYQAIISGYLQSVGRVLASNVVTIVRQFLFFTPIMILLSYLFEMKGLSSSYLISNIISFIILYIWMRKEIRENLCADENYRKPLPSRL
jgi:putative MATE family efflux protein